MNQKSFVKDLDAAADEASHTLLPVERQPWELYALVGGICAQSTLILLGNQPSVATWLLTFLLLAVGQSLLLPSTAGWLGGLAVVVVWVLFRQTTGIWTPDLPVQNLLEVAGLALNVMFTMRYRYVWGRQQQELQELRALRHLLVAGEDSTGLLSHKVAGLRLREEVDRAQRFQRPLGLLLIKVGLLAERATEDTEIQEIGQAVARQLASTSLVHDIPFRMNASHLGMILPERTASRLYEDAEAIAAALQGTSFLNGKGRTQPVMHYAQLHFGLGTYQGEKGNIDLMRAAVDSLNISGNLSEYGEQRALIYAMPATPVELVAPVASNEEE